MKYRPSLGFILASTIVLSVGIWLLALALRPATAHKAKIGFSYEPSSVLENPQTNNAATNR
jgi:hypothetical protein